MSKNKHNTGSGTRKRPECNPLRLNTGRPKHVVGLKISLLVNLYHDFEFLSTKLPFTSDR